MINKFTPYEDLNYWLKSLNTSSLELTNKTKIKVQDHYFFYFFFLFISLAKKCLNVKIDIILTRHGMSEMF